MTRRNDMEPGMNETLKAAGHIGAELGAARAEIEALRAQVKALQSDANSWQSGYDKGRHDGARHRKSEVDQLRGLLRRSLDYFTEPGMPEDLLAEYRAALSKQAEPAPIQADTVNWKAVANEQKSIIEQLQAKLNAKSEPAPAQDEQEWTYCPECGSEEVRHQEGTHKQCANCHQEWFSDIDYTGVVRGHLATRPAQTEQQPEQGHE